jgi:hypothetical protein
MLNERMTEVKSKLEGFDFDGARALIEDLKGTVSESTGLQQEAEESIRSAISIVQLAKRYGIDVKSGESMLDKAQKMKSTNPEQAIKIAMECQNNVTQVLDGLSPKLEVSIQTEGLTKDEWKPVKLVIKNIGKGLAKDVLILSDSPSVEIEGLKDLAALMGGTEKEIELKAKANKFGEVDLKFIAKPHRVFDNKEYEFDAEHKVKVVPFTFKKSTAPEDLRCGVCKGTIKKGMVMITCNCGEHYHDPCASRKAQCPKCGKNIKAPKAQKKLALKIG